MQTLTLGQLKDLIRADDCHKWQNEITGYLMNNLTAKDTAFIEVRQSSLDLLLKEGLYTNK